jgi:hypothetical protein
MLAEAADAVFLLISVVPETEVQPAQIERAQRPARAFFIVFIVIFLSVCILISIPGSLSVPVFQLDFIISKVRCQGISGVMTL